MVRGRVRAVPGRGTLVCPDSAAHQRGRGARRTPSDRLVFSAMRWSLLHLTDNTRTSQGKAIAHLEGKNVVEPSPYTCAALSCQCMLSLLPMQRSSHE